LSNKETSEGWSEGWRGGGLQAKEQTEKLILATLIVEGHSLTWSELLEKTGLSKRTLAKRLDALQKQGLVKREVDVRADSYPHPVYYELTQGAHDPNLVKAAFFAKAVSNSFGIDIWKSTYPLEEREKLKSSLSPEEFLRDLSNKISSFVLFLYLKNLEERAENPRDDTLWVYQDRRTRSMLSDFSRLFLDYNLRNRIPDYAGFLETQNKNELKAKVRNLTDAFKAIFKNEENALNILWNDPHWRINIKTGERLGPILLHHVGSLPGVGVMNLPKNKRATKKARL